MPDDFSSTPANQATGKPRVVWRDNLPYVAVDDDGVVSLHKLGLVPHALWQQGIMLKLPDWAVGVDDPGAQFLAILVESVGQRRDAVAELREARVNLKSALTLIGEAPGLAAVTARLEAALKRVNALSSALDLP